MSEVRRTEEIVTTNYPDAPVEQVQTVTTDPYAARRLGVYRAQQVLYTILTIIEGLLIIRFALRLLAANAAAGFSSLIYTITAPLVAPFVGLFATPAARNGSVLELYTLVALIIYPLLFWVLVRLLWLAFGEDRTAVVTRQVETRRIDPPL